MQGCLAVICLLVVAIAGVAHGIVDKDMSSVLLGLIAAGLLFRTNEVDDEFAQIKKELAKVPKEKAE